MRPLAGKVALITGSSRGIGSAIARRFAQEGATVVLHGRDHGALSAVQAEIAWGGDRAIQVAADVTDFKAIELMRHQIEATVGAVDILVANAGGAIIAPGPFESITEAGWHAAVDGNLTATFLTIKSFLPGMRARGEGNIITISSAAGRRAHPQSPVAYAVAKAGIQMLTQQLAAQLGPTGIRVNCIAPATILTERNRVRIPEDQLARLVDEHPLRRLGTPDDIASAAFFLASDASAWQTGIILDVAGGAVLA